MGFSRPANTKGKYIVYTLVIKNVTPKEKVDAFMKERMQQLKNKEAVSISGYIAEKHLKTEIRPSGLQYVITSNGTGNTAKPGDTVDLRYTGSFLNGKVFDRTPRPPEGAGGRLRYFIAGLNTTIAGLEESLLLFPEGTTATVIIPAALAFGEQGYEGIQPYTPLVYRLQIARIRRMTGKRPTAKGAQMPVFAFTNIADNTVVQNEDLPKRKIIFFLFDTGCDHCQQEVEAIGKQSAAFNNAHLYFVSQNSQQDINQFMQVYGKPLLSRPNVTVLQDNDRRLMGTFQAFTYPSVYVYSAQHRLISYFAGQAATGDIIKAVNKTL
jgi:FKBP-type peptidyl-prolyl cis-trans isomerase/peroxiredoxin